MRTDRDISPIRLFGFTPAWGLPFYSCAPFPIKLENWLRMAELPYEPHVENNPAKGPKKKSPWIEDDRVRMGDSELIIRYLKERYGVDPDAHLTPAQRAEGLAWHRLFEEHYHQVWEYLHFCTPEGEVAAGEIFDTFPALLRPLIKRLMISGLRKQIWARGVGRHSLGDIHQMGIADLEAVSEFLGDKPFMLGDEPATVDACAFAFLALTIWTPNISPVHARARALPNLVAYCARMAERYYPEATDRYEAHAVQGKPTARPSSIEGGVARMSA